MYLRILEGFPNHWKTLALARKLDDHNAGMYCLRLWTWACRSAPSGDLSNVDPLDIELIVDWRGEPGRCFAAMVAVRLIDRCEDGAAEIHEWADHTGGDIETMEARAAEKRADAAERKRQERARKAVTRDSHAPVTPVTRDTGVTVTPCHAPRQDQARQDKTGQDQPAQSDARAGDPTTPGPVALAHAVAVAVEQAGETWARETFTTLDPAPPTWTLETFTTLDAAPPPPPRSMTAHDVLLLFGRIRAELDSACMPWHSPGGSARQKAQELLDRIGGDAEALADIEPTMRLHLQRARTSADARDREVGFSFGSWLHRFTDLREELRGARKPAAAAKDCDFHGGARNSGKRAPKHAYREACPECRHMQARASPRAPSGPVSIGDAVATFTGR